MAVKQARTRARFLVAFVTCPDRRTAKRLAQLLVEHRLAACVNIIGGIESIYRWQSKVEQAKETLLVIKTTRARYAALEASIRKHHPYQTPEVIAWPIESGMRSYLDWVFDSVV